MESCETISAFSNLHCILCGMFGQRPFVSFKRTISFLWLSTTLCFCFFYPSQAPKCFFYFSQLLRCDLNKLRWALSAIWELLSVSASSVQKNIHLNPATYLCIQAFLKTRETICLWDNISLKKTKQTTTFTSLGIIGTKQIGTEKKAVQK